MIFCYVKINLCQIYVSFDASLMQQQYFTTSLRISLPDSDLEQHSLPVDHDGLLITIIFIVSFTINCLLIEFLGSLEPEFEIQEIFDHHSDVFHYFDNVGIIYFWQGLQQAISLAVHNWWLEWWFSQKTVSKSLFNDCSNTSNDNFSSFI